MQQPVATITRLFLVRHALVEPSARAMLYGAMDVALCDATLREEAALHRWLAFRLPQPAHWVVSGLSRTRATAAAIFAAGYGETELAEEPDLAEQHLGEWQGLPHEALAERLRHAPHPFWPHGAEEKPPGGESFAEVRARVGPLIERLADRHAGGDVVAVAHGGSIRAAIAHALDLSAHQAFGFSIRNLGLTRLERHGADWRVAAVNEEPWTPPGRGLSLGQPGALPVASRPGPLREGDSMRRRWLGLCLGLAATALAAARMRGRPAAQRRGAGAGRPRHAHRQRGLRRRQRSAQRRTPAAPRPRRCWSARASSRPASSSAARAATACWSGRDAAGSWSSPAFYLIKSGSFGLQAGIQDLQVVMLIFNDRALTAVLDNQLKLGADASVAVATFGGSVEASTTAAVGADILAFARARGLYAGLTLEGSLLSARSEWNRAYYRQDVSPRQIAVGMQAHNPGADPLRAALMRHGSGGGGGVAAAPPPPPPSDRGAAAGGGKHGGERADAKRPRGPHAAAADALNDRRARDGGGRTDKDDHATPHRPPATLLRAAAAASPSPRPGRSGACPPGRRSPSRPAPSASSCPSRPAAPPTCWRASSRSA